MNSSLQTKQSTVPMSDLSSNSEHSSSINTSRNNPFTEYVEHIVLPSDTLQGICIQYKVSSSILQKVNNFSGSTLCWAPKRLFIPLKGTTTIQDSENDSDSNNSINVTDSIHRNGIRLQDRTQKEYKIHKFLFEVPCLSTKEVDAYLELCDWNVSEAIKLAKDDIQWEKPTRDETSESKSITPPPTSYFNVTQDNLNLNFRIIHNIPENDREKELGATSLLELKEMHVNADKWEEVSHANSFNSCGSEAEVLCHDDQVIPPLYVPAFPPNTQNCYTSPLDFGIELQDMSNSMN